MGGGPLEDLSKLQLRANGRSFIFGGRERAKHDKTKIQRLKKQLKHMVSFCSSCDIL